MRKWDNPIGINNKDRILEIIRKDHGIRQHKIIENSNLSRQTVYTHLNKLKSEDKIYEKNGQYFVKDLDTSNILLFARGLRESGLWLLMNEITKMVNSVVSKNFHEDRIPPNFAYRHLFEFVNTLGAYITYVFIESIRITKNQDHNFKTDVNELQLNLINNAIHIKKLFAEFERLFGFYEVEELLEIHEQLFPYVKKTLENDWKESIEDSVAYSTSWAEQMPCKHKWVETYIYKLGKFYECPFCNCLVISPTKLKKKKPLSKF